MKTNRNLLAVGMLLAALPAGFGQPTIQFATATYSVAEHAGFAALTVQRLNDTSGTVNVDYVTATITILDTTGMSPHRFEGAAVLPDGNVGDRGMILVQDFYTSRHK